MLMLLIDPNGLKFANIYLYSTSNICIPYQTLSKILKCVKDIGYFPYADIVPIIKEIDAKLNFSTIFDDLVCDIPDICALFQHRSS